MAVCRECGQEMQEATGCTVGREVVGNRFVDRVPFGSERPRSRMAACGDCGVLLGSFHHPGCDIEQCPSCGEQALMCGCADNSEDPGDDLVDVPVAIEIMAQLLTNSPEWDHVNILPVAVCGHVGRGPVRQLDRERQLPLEEWFELGLWGGDETVAVLFVVRSEDLERLSEADLDIARSFADYAASHRELPWELIFVTRQGSFKASELLQLPGLPVFERCDFRTVADIPN